MRAAAAHRSNGDDHRRSELLRQALDELDARDAARARRRGAGRAGERAVVDRPRRGQPRDAAPGAGAAPREDHAAERAELLSRQVAFLMLQGRYGEVRDAAEEALELAARGRRARAARPGAPPPRLVAVRARRGGGGPPRLRRRRSSLARARASRSSRVVLSNFSDALHRAGHSREGLAVAIEGRRTLPRGTRADRWVPDAARRGRDRARATGTWPRRTCRDARPRHGHDARQRQPAVGLDRCSAAATRRAARPLLEEHGACSCSRSSPSSSPGRASARELERRAGNLTAARAAVDDAIDRIEFCSEDGERLADVACVGRRRGGRRRRARRRRRRPRGGARSPAARRHDGHARAGRGRGHGPRRRRGARRHARPPSSTRAEGEPDPAPGRPPPRRGRRSSARTRPRIARWREAEAHLRGGDRDRDGRRRPRGGRVGRASSAARWLPARSRAWPPAPGCASAEDAEPAAAEPTPQDEDPFGLTPRERQVLALLAGRRHQPRDRRAAVHGREDRQRARLAHPRQARRPQPDRGGRGRAPPRAGGRSPEGI